MGGKPSAPTPPNPQTVAAAQTQSNVQTAMANAALNNINTYGPTGSTEFNRTGEFQTVEVKLPSGRTQRIQVPLWESHQDLTRDQQHLLDLQEKAGINLGQIANQQSEFLEGYLKGGIDPNGLPARVQSAPDAAEYMPQQFHGSADLQRGFDGAQDRMAWGYDAGGNIQKDVGPIDYENARKSVEDAIYSRLNPQFDRDQSAMETRLANQGIVQGSQAYTRAMDQLGRNRNDARMQAVIVGGQEQSRLAGLDVQQGQFHNTAQAQANSQNKDAAAFNNATQGQTYSQNQGLAQFYNQAEQQGFQNDMNVTGFNNQANAQSYEMLMAQAQMQQTLRQQALQEEIALRNQPLSEMSQLLNGSQPTLPQFQGWTPSNIANTPVGQYYYQSAALEQQAYQSQMSQQNAAMGGLFGIGSAGLGLFSDRRLKDNIKRVGTLDNGLGVYAYTMGGVPQIGLIAQEVEKVKPEAVREVSGFKTVRYDLAVEA